MKHYRMSFVVLAGMSLFAQISTGQQMMLPSIDIEKATNGVDADDAQAGDAPTIPINGPVVWTYVVTNDGDVDLVNVVVNDNRGEPVTCPQTELPSGEQMVCTANGIAVDVSNAPGLTVEGICDGQLAELYENIGTVTAGFGNPVLASVQDDDPSHYCNGPAGPSIDVEKSTNGVDADDPNAGDAPTVAEGDAVAWTYTVINDGDVGLVNVVVTDDQGVTVTCPQNTLAVGETMICSAGESAVDLSNTPFTTVPGSCAGVPGVLYENVATATADFGNPVIESVMDTDPSHYCNPPLTPSIDVEKTTNGIDADDPDAGDAPLLFVGAPISWVYAVTNNGELSLVDVTVTDDQGVAVTCPKTQLAIGETMYCTAGGTAVDIDDTVFTTVTGTCGSEPDLLYENIATAVGSFGDPVAGNVMDTDPSHYCNPPPTTINAPLMHGLWPLVLVLGLVVGAFTRMKPRHRDG